MNFDHADAEEVIKVILGDSLKVNYSIDVPLNFYISMMTNKSLTERQIILFIMANLDENGFVMQDGDDGQIHIRRKSSAFERVGKFIMDQPAFSASIAFFLLALIISHIIYLIRPLWILPINAFLTKGELEFPSPLTGIKLPIRHALIIGFYEYNNRVLDAWVLKYAETVHEKFSRLPTVDGRSIRIPIPVVVDGNSPTLLDSNALVPLCKKSRWCLFIRGEGGSGKTALACSMGLWSLSKDERFTQHMMIPILVEPDVQTNSLDTEFMIKFVQGALDDLVGQVRSISREFVLAMLRRQRIFVIVDGLSEMGELAKKSLLPKDTDFPIAALVVTSRSEEYLGGISKSTLTIPQISGDRLSSFMEGYLTKLGKRESMGDETFFDACRTLSRLVGQRSITVLLAKMYAELIIPNESTSGVLAFNSVPELMLGYLNELNRRGPGSFSDSEVQLAAESVSYACVKSHLYPEPVSLKIVNQILDCHNLGSILDHLQHVLKLVQVEGVRKDRVRFTLDPLAEYLAAIYIISQFIDNGNTKPSYSAIRFVVKALRQNSASRGMATVLIDVCDSSLFLFNKHWSEIIYILRNNFLDSPQPKNFKLSSLVNKRPKKTNNTYNILD